MRIFKPLLIQINKIFILFLGIMALSCADSVKKEGTVINGQFQNASGVKLVLRELGVDSIQNVDSVILDDKGLFRIRINPPDAGFYILKSSSGDYILFLLDKDEEINISADMEKQPFDYKVNGSQGSALLKDFYDLTLPNLRKADSLRSVLMENRDAPDFYKLTLAFDTLFSNLINNQKNIEETFINQNPNSLASLIVLNYKFGMTPVLNLDADFPVFYKLDSTLYARYPHNKHVEFHHKRVIEHQREEREKQSLRKSKF